MTEKKTLIRTSVGSLVHSCIIVQWHKNRVTIKRLMDRCTQ